MIAELYSYGVKHEIGSTEGVKEKKIVAEIYLFSDKSHSITILEKKSLPRLCLDSGSAAQGSKVCNFPSEKAGIIFPELFVLDGKLKEREKKQGKTEFYYATLKNLSENLPRYLPLYEILSDESIKKDISKQLFDKKIKSSDVVTFVFNGEEIDQPFDSELKAWWAVYYKKNVKEKAEKKKEISKEIICGISGTKEVSSRQPFGKVHTLVLCGGHASGDVLMGYDKAAFESYGLKGNENSGVSENSASIANATFEALSKDAPLLGGKRWVCWYSDKIPVDVIEVLEKPEEYNELDKLFGNFESDDAEAAFGYDMKYETAIEKKVKDMLCSFKNGKDVFFSDTKYYIACVSGAGGRVRYHSWYTGKYANICENLNKWWNDLYVPFICEKKPNIYSLERAMFRVKRESEQISDYYDAMHKINGNLEKALMESALFNRPVPYRAALSTFQNIRKIIIASNAGDSSENEKKLTWDQKVPRECFALLKIYLLRKNRKGGFNMSNTINTDSQAYQWGRAFAVYERTKNIATKWKPGVSVAEKYFDSASRTPFKVGRSLESEYHHHLDKIEKQGTRIYLDRVLSEIYAAIGDGIELTRPLNQEEQFLFTLGFRQQTAEMNKKIMDENQEKKVEIHE